MKTYLSYLFLFIIFVSCNPSDSSTAVTKDEILWDSYGVPHIYATNQKNLYYMAGWGHMKNHGNLVLKLYGEARGMSGELWGEGIELNKTLHLLGIYDQVETSYSSLPSKYQDILTAFAEGVNAYAEENKEELDKKYLNVLPIKETDIIAHLFRVVNYEFLIRGQFLSAARMQAGSNSWALAGSKTSTGNAMLVVNPHLWWSDLFLWHEQQFITNEYNMYGASLVGIPSMILGFNDFVSWTHTVNTIDNTDLFKIQKKDNTYFLDGEWLPFEEQTFTLKELKEDGSFEEHEIIQKKTKHGIVVKEFEESVIAIRFAQMENFVPSIEQYDLMGRAKNLADMEAALALRQMPFLNTVYADVEGTIMHHFGGLVPKKNGDWDKWQGVVSGDSSINIWSDYYSSQELPKVVNPPTGWLQNSNDPPFVNTVPPVLKPETFKSHIAPVRMSFRPQRAARILHEEDNISFERLVELKHDNKAELALRLQDDLLSLKEFTSDSLVLAAIETLTTWDGSYDGDSLGSIFFMEFTNTIYGEKRISPYQIGEFLKKPWSIENPISTPDGFKDSDEVITLIKKAAESHLSKYPALKVPYGDYYKLRIGDHEYPGTGGPQHLGVFRILYTSPDEDGKFVGNFGDTFVLVVEMGEEVKAKGLLSYGNSSNPNSKHFGDQLELFSKNELRPIWSTRAEQEQNLQKIESLEDISEKMK